MRLDASGQLPRRRPRFPFDRFLGALLRAGLTVETVAPLAGLSPVRVYAWRRRRAPPASELEAVLEAAGIAITPGPFWPWLDAWVMCPACKWWRRLPMSDAWMRGRGGKFIRRGVTVRLDFGGDHFRGKCHRCHKRGDIAEGRARVLVNRGLTAEVDSRASHGNDPAALSARRRALTEQLRRNRSRVAYSIDDVEAAVESARRRLSEAASGRAIARELGVNRSTLRWWLAAAGVESRRRPLVHELCFGCEHYVDVADDYVLVERRRRHRECVGRPRVKAGARGNRPGRAAQEDYTLLTARLRGGPPQLARASADVRGERVGRAIRRLPMDDPLVEKYPALRSYLTYLVKRGVHDDWILHLHDNGVSEEIVARRTGATLPRIRGIAARHDPRRPPAAVELPRPAPAACDYRVDRLVKKLAAAGGGLPWRDLVIAAPRPKDGRSRAAGLDEVVREGVRVGLLDDSGEGVGSRGPVGRIVHVTAAGAAAGA